MPKLKETLASIAGYVDASSEMQQRYLACGKSVVQVYRFEGALHSVVGGEPWSSSLTLHTRQQAGSLQTPYNPEPGPSLVYRHEQKSLLQAWVNNGGRAPTRAGCICAPLNFRDLHHRSSRQKERRRVKMLKEHIIKQAPKLER